MDNLQYIVLLGATVNFIGALIYLRATLQGKTKPNKVTWLLWALAPLIATSAALSDGVRWAVLPVFMAGFCPLLIFISSFFNPKAYWKLETFDYLCGIFSLIALLLWGLTSSALLAILFAIMSDGLAAVPTLRKTWKYPNTEAGAAYITGLFNALTSFFAFKTFTLTELAFPIYLIIMCITLLICVYKNEIRKLYTRNT